MWMKIELCCVDVVASCGGCGLRAGAYAMPCYGDNTTSTETCHVLKEYTYDCRGWWGRRSRCTG